jgi:hypothetical protein
MNSLIRWIPRPLSRHPVDDAQGAEGVAVGRDEGSARVEPDVGRRDHERVVAEALVAQRIRDDEELTLLDGVGAEGDAPGGFPGRDAHIVRPAVLFHRKLRWPPAKSSGRESLTSSHERR